jgi:hypothetical protein
MKNLDDINVARRRAGLRRLMQAKSINPTTLAHMIRAPTANALFNFLNGATKSLSLDTIERIMLAFPDVSFRDLVGIDTEKSTDDAAAASISTVFVSIEARSAVWQPQFELPVDKWTPLIPPDLIGRDAAELFGVRVKWPGAELLYPDGSVLVCQRLIAGNSEPQHGHRYVVQERRGKRSRVTIQEARVFEGRMWLWPRSSHPRHQTPTLLGSDLATTSSVNNEPMVSLKGLVVGSWQPDVLLQDA